MVGTADVMGWLDVGDEEEKIRIREAEFRRHFVPSGQQRVSTQMDQSGRCLAQSQFLNEIRNRLRHVVRFTGTSRQLSVVCQFKLFERELRGIVMRQPRPQLLYEGQHLRLMCRGSWEYADRCRGSGVVAIVAVTRHNELVLTEQFRPAIQKKVVDLAAGLAGDVAGEEDEAFERAARRELLEETGFEGDEFRFIFSGPTSAGMITEMVDFFLATDVRQTEAGGGDDSEEIHVHLVPLKRIIPWLKRKTTRKRCIDPKVYAALGILAHMKSG